MFGGKIPPNVQVVGYRLASHATSEYYAVGGEPLMTNTDFRDARPTLDENNRPVVAFVLSPDAASRVGAITAANIGRQVALVLDNRLLSAPRITDRIGTEGWIQGLSTAEEAAELSLFLRAGALPAPLELIEQRTVSPSLVEHIDARRAVLFAGAFFVVLLVVAFYE